MDLNKVSRARQNDYSIITQAKRFGGECILVARVLEFLTEGTREQSSKGGWVFSEENERKEVYLNAKLAFNTLNTKKSPS